MPIFDADTQTLRSKIDKYVEGKVKASYVHSQVSTLGGVSRAAIIVRVSLDPKSKWSNGIYQNSRYAMFRLDRNGTLEQFAQSYLLKKMRKQKATSVPDAIARINKYLSSVR